MVCLKRFDLERTLKLDYSNRKAWEVWQNDPAFIPRSSGQNKNGKDFLAFSFGIYDGEFNLLPGPFR